MHRLALVVPCFNEEALLQDTALKLGDCLNSLKQKQIITQDSYVCFVDDGSTDTTWTIINQLVLSSATITGIKLSRNFGHQNALIAGMFTERLVADCIVTIDADLQDDISVIEEMLFLYQKGFKVVYGVRENRENDTYFKRRSAELFYRLMESMKVKTVFNHADFRLIDSRVAGELEKFGESGLFLRGIVPLIGFPSTIVHYKRNKRTAGETKYPLSKMVSFAWTAITSFSTTPLRLIFYTGITMFIASVALGLWIIVSLIKGHTIQGWASSLLLNVTFAGVHMICLGIMGEYIGKIYQEVKQRPRFIIEKTISHVNRVQQGAV